MFVKDEAGNEYQWKVAAADVLEVSGLILK